MKILNLTAVLGMMVLATASVAGQSVVLGRVVSSKHADEVAVPCPEDAICLHSWWRWVIEVDETISGPKINGRVVSARMQHANMRKAVQKHQRLFVLKPIDSSGERSRLGADFYLEDMSVASEMYCLWTDPKEVGLDERTYVSGQDDNKRYCFELPDTH